MFVDVPRLTSRSHVRWLVATGVGLVVVAVWLVVTDAPGTSVPAIVAVLGGLCVAVVVVLTARTVVDVDRGVVVRTRLRVLRHEVPLAGAQVELVPNGGGGLLLGVRPPGARRRTFLPVLALTDYVERSQPPQLLRALADAVVQHDARGGTRVARLLREQADAVDRGSPARSTPLAPLVTHGALRAAKAGGAAGAGGALID